MHTDKNNTIMAGPAGISGWVLLLGVSLLWAFSFGLIKKYLVGVPPDFVAWLRLALALVVFLPFFRRGKVPGALRWPLLLIGAVQYGVMYLAYLRAFHYLRAYEVALFTILTPLYVALLADARQKRTWLAAALAVAGAAVVVFRPLERWDLLAGFLLVQVSNLSFAFGQVYYRRLMARQAGVPDAVAYVFVYAGAVGLASLALVAGGAPWTAGGIPALSPVQWLVLIYLGVLASGWAFFLWNVGARRVSAGVLAVMNNLKVPLAILCALLFFGETADPLRLAVGGALVLLALGVSHRRAA